jgi:L-fucose mutarotase
VPSAPVERFEFYRRAASAYVVVATTEARPYGCFLVTKGVV